MLCTKIQVIRTSRLMTIETVVGGSTKDIDDWHLAVLWYLLTIGILDDQT